MKYLNLLNSKDFEKQERLLDECLSKRKKCLNALKVIGLSSEIADDIKNEYVKDLEKKISKCDAFLVSYLSTSTAEDNPKNNQKEVVEQNIQQEPMENYDNLEEYAFDEL